MEYRLVSELDYYIISDDKILLTESGKKLLPKKIGSLIRKQGLTLVRYGTLKDTTGFIVKSGGSGDILIKHPKIYPDKFFKVLHLSHEKDNLVYLLGCSNSIDRVFTDPLEASFSIESDSEVFFMKHGTPEYNEAWGNFVRDLNSEVKKKTKKYIPGHLYATKNYSLVYIGETYKPEEDGSVRSLQVFIEDQKPVGSISDYMRNITDSYYYRTPPRTLDLDSTSLVFIEKPGCMVDLGEYLQADATDIQEYWLDFIKNQNKDSLGFVDRPGVFKVIDLIHYSLESSPVIPGIPELSEMIKSYILRDIVFDQRFGKSIRTIEIDKNKSISENTETVLKLLELDDCSDEYVIIPVLRRLGVDLEGIISECLQEVDRLDITSDFDTYRKYSRYIPGALNYSHPYNLSDDSGNLRRLIQDPEIYGIIIEMIEIAKENLGLSKELFDYFMVYSCYSDVKNPTINMKISLENIIDYVGESNLTESLKASLMSMKFSTLGLNFERKHKFI